MTFWGKTLIVNISPSWSIWHTLFSFLLFYSTCLRGRLLIKPKLSTIYYSSVKITFYLCQPVYAFRSHFLPSDFDWSHLFHLPVNNRRSKWSLYLALVTISSTYLHCANLTPIDYLHISNERNRLQSATIAFEMSYYYYIKEIECFPITTTYARSPFGLLFMCYTKQTEFVNIFMISITAESVTYWCSVFERWCGTFLGLNEYRRSPLADNFNDKWVKNGMYLDQEGHCWHPLCLKIVHKAAKTLKYVCPDLKFNVSQSNITHPNLARPFQ